MASVQFVVNSLLMFVLAFAKSPISLQNGSKSEVLTRTEGRPVKNGAATRFYRLQESAIGQIWNNTQILDGEMTSSPWFHRTEETRNRRSLTVAPVTGPNIRALMVLVKLSNHQQRALPDRSYFQQLCDGGWDAGDTVYFNPKFGTAAHYFFQQSGGRYKVTCYVADWLLVNETEATYAAPNCTYATSNCTEPEIMQKLSWPVMDQLQMQLTALQASKYGTSNQNDWWKEFDSNGDFAFDVFIIVHSGYSQQSKGWCDLTIPSDRIASQGYVETPNGAGWKSTTYDSSGKAGIRISNFAILSAFNNEYPLCSNDNAAVTNNAVRLSQLVNEWTKMFPNTFKLYDQAVLSKTAGAQVGGLGNFDLLASLGRVDGSLSPYTKLKLGWVNVEEVQGDGLITLREVNNANKVFRISNKFDADEYLLIEYRELIGYDANIVARDSTLSLDNGGILIYHVYEQVENNLQGGVPPKRYRVALIQKDAKFDLEKGVNGGDAGDFWTSGDILRDETSDNVNTYSYTKGSTGVIIRIYTGSEEDMQIAVTGISNQTVPFPTPRVPAQSPTTSAPTMPKPINIPTSSRPPSTETNSPTTPPSSTAVPGKPTTSNSNNSGEQGGGPDKTRELWLVTLPLFLAAIAAVLYIIYRRCQRLRRLNSYDATDNQGHSTNPDHWEERDRDLI